MARWRYKRYWLSALKGLTFDLELLIKVTANSLLTGGILQSLSKMKPKGYDIVSKICHDRWQEKNGLKVTAMFFSHTQFLFKGWIRQAMGRIYDTEKIFESSRINLPFDQETWINITSLAQHTLYNKSTLYLSPSQNTRGLCLNMLDSITQFISRYIRVHLNKNK